MTGKASVDIAIDEMRKIICSGEYGVGDKLPTEAEWTEKLAMSRSTVREAMRFLQATGYLEIIHGRGAFVRAIISAAESPEKWLREKRVTLQDFFELRMALEPQAARLAAKNISDTQLKKLQDLFVQFEIAYEKKDDRKITAFDEKIHQCIFEATGNPLFPRLYAEICALLQEYSRNTLQLPLFRQNALEPHRAIIRAIACHDPDDAFFEMLAHIRLARRLFEEQVER